VIRGPATLRYGSQAIGGVVESTNNRIPTALPCRDDGVNRSGWQASIFKASASDQSRPCVSVETRGAVSTGDNGLNGAVLLDAGGGNFAIHADAFGRQADDYRIPRYPYLTPPSPAEAPNATQPSAFNGRQPNSSLRTEGHSVGGSYVFNDGFIGLAVSQNNALYHIPGIDGENHRTRIDGHQTVISSRGEWRGPVEWIDAVRYWAGTTDYRHTELGLADPFDLASDGARQTFTNREQEGRIEMQLAPGYLRFATLTTTIGTQAGYQQLTAPSPDDPTSPLNGLWDPNHNWRVATYIFNELKFNDNTKAQIAGRIENVNLSGTTPSLIPTTFDINADPASIGPATAHDLNFVPKSASVGVIQNLFWDLIGSVTAQYVERAPKPAELFSRGAHDATATFDIGNPNLRIESARSIEAGLRRSTGPFRFELTAYYTRFSGFIFRRLTGNTCDESACVDASDPNPLELRQAIYSQRDATFRGAEFQSQYDLAPLWTGTFGVENQFDVVRATFTDGTNVPRIPPVRIGGGVFWRNDNWLMRTSLLHAFPQKHIAITGETPTPGYNDLRAEVSYRWKPRTPSHDNLSEIALGIAGTNLLNDDIRNHVSYNKDEVLMPGRSVRVFANLKY
jgi:iron complex outermembrane receptor protein